MKIKASAITAAALLALAAQAANAAEAVGYNVVTVPANSDVLVSVPFNNNVEATFTVDSVTGTGITVNEALSADTYNSSYYIRVIDGAGEGLWSTITANGSGGLTIADDLSGYIANGDTFRVYAHQTIGSVFPAGMYGVSYTNRVSINVYNNTANGINKSATTSVSYHPGLKRWTNLNQILNPDSMILIRNNSAAELSYICNGDVPDYDVALLVPAGVAKDTLISSGFPVAVQASAVSALTGRSINLYNNSAASQNKSPVTSTSYHPGLQRWTNPSLSIPSSEGMLLRTSVAEVGGKVTIQKPY